MTATTPPLTPGGSGTYPLLPAYYGEFGGQYVAEGLLPALDQLEQAFVDAMADEEFMREYRGLLRDYLGRPTPLTQCRNLPLDGANARIFLKREDLVHGGAHKTNQVIGQALLAKKMGKTRVVAETGAGQHGTATALACALLDLKCVIYMGTKDMARQEPNVYRMRLMGAEVIGVESGAGTLKDAVNEALRDWTATFHNTHYLLGTAAGPHPFPKLVKEFHRVISTEARAQMLERIGALPDVVTACVGGGSNAIGMFADFIDDEAVELVGAEPGGEGFGLGKHGAAINAGTVGILHGTRSYLMRDSDGQVEDSYSISAGLDYPAVGPEHAYLAHTGRASYVPISDEDALKAFQLLSRYEGIIPALESSHALAYALRRAAEAPTDGEPLNILVSLSGRGDKDIAHIRRTLEQHPDWVVEDRRPNHRGNVTDSAPIADNPGAHTAGEPTEHTPADPSAEEAKQ